MADIFELFKQISKDNSGAAGAPTHMIVGLGNPGKDYAETRHNAGFLAMDKICASLGCECQRVKFKAFTNTVKIGDKSVLLMMPQTYMNLSGEAVGEAASYYNIPAENIIVLVDDIYLEPGYMRIRKKGSAGGHNGLKDIIAKCGGDGFPRVKIGVGEKPHPDYDMADWVLSSFKGDDAKTIDTACEKAADAVKAIILKGVDKAMSMYN